jgi:hypothetical protein
VLGPVPRLSSCSVVKSPKRICYDTIIEPGILVAQAFFDTNGAVKIEARDGPFAVGNVLIENVDAESSTFAGIEFEGP